MKRIWTLALAAWLVAPQPAPAPIPIGLAIGLKCVAIGVIIETGYILSQCQPKCYLVEIEEEGEPPHWIASCASAATIRKNLTWRRCEGPGTPEEMKFRADCNNADPAKPMFPCGPLGGPLPNPTWTNYSILHLQASTDGGRSWVSQAEVPAYENEDISTVAVLSASGTNGLTAEQIYQVLSSDVVTTNLNPGMVFFRVQATP